MARRAKAVKSVRPSNGNGASALATAPDSQVPQVDRQQLFQEISSNTWRFGFHQERLLNPDELVGRKGMRIYRQMLADDQVKAALALKKHAILSTGWDVVPASDSPQDVEVAEFCAHVFTKMDGSLDDNLLSILSALQFGFSCSELVYRPLISGQFTGKIGLRAIKTRKPDEFAFLVDAHDNLLENGIEQFGRKMPSWKFVIFSAGKEFDNHYGTSDLRAAYRCYSDDTRVLTKAGWKFFEDVRLTDEMATLDPKTGQMEYRQPTKVFHYSHQGKMFHQGGRFVDLLVTGNHRMWVADRLKPPYNFGFKEAKDLPQRVRYKRDAEWIGEEQEWFELPAITIRQRMSNHTGGDFGTRETIRPVKRIQMDDWLRFFGIWLAEGHTNHSKQAVVGITQKEGPKSRQIARWISAAGFHAGEKIYEGKVVFEITDKQLHMYLLQFGKSHDKFIPRELLNLSSRQLRILYDAMMFGDGSGKRYATVSDQLADDMTEIILKTGGAPIKRKDVSKNRFGSGAVWIIHRDECNIGGTICNEHIDNRSWVDYSGDVWCVEVPPHHLLYVERNGKSCWSGNSWWLKDFVLKAWGIFLDRYSVPLALGTYPAGSPLADGQVAAFRSALEGLQLATTMTMPADFKVDFPAVGAQGSSVFDLAINRQDAAIARAILVPNLLGVSPQGNVGSYSQARKQFDVFILVIEKLQRDLAETVLGEQIIRRLVDLNYRVEEYPKFTFLPFTETDKTQLMNLFFQAVAAGGVTPRPEDEVHIRTVTEFPEVPLEELQAAVEAAKAQQPGMIPSQTILGQGEVLPDQEESTEESEGEPELSDEELDDLIDEVLDTEKANA